jgi:hypothetical protein
VRSRSSDEEEEVNSQQLKVESKGKKKAVARALILRTWGAAVLRPYNATMADAVVARLTAEILRFAQDDSAF